MSDRLALEVGDAAARLGHLGASGSSAAGRSRGGGPSFSRFRRSAVELLARRWHLLTAASLVGSLSVFVVLLVSLRALNVPRRRSRWSRRSLPGRFVRLLGTIPITPGGLGVIELGLTTSLIAFGGNNAGVVAAVLVFRFLTIVPTIVYGLVAAGTWRRHRPPLAETAGAHPVETTE